MTNSKNKQGTSMFEAPESEYLVPFDGTFRIGEASTVAVTNRHQHKGPHRKQATDSLKKLQRVLAAGDRHAILLVFQAMDAAGKDSTIRAVMQGVDPSGCQVFSFKKPSSLEIDHDFLWRTVRCLPERGRIGIFNRSHYEEVLVVRAHPEYLGGQRIPREVPLDQLWEERFESIRDVERHLARNGTVILKFWLNVSRDEQKARFLDRIDEPESNWKFAAGDLRERALWDTYMEAYEDALNATSRTWAPWYAIPADKKPFMRLEVARVVLETLKGLNLSYPSVSTEDREEMQALREQLAND